MLGRSHGRWRAFTWPASIIQRMQKNKTVEEFIERWQGIKASELSTSQSFVIDLCELLGVSKPHATPEQDYMFERPVTFTHGDGSTSAGRIDCYRRGHFVLEAKKLKAGNHTKGFDDGLLRARSQGEGYARALPAAEGRPPFVLVVDVGNVIEVYAEFSRTGGTYTPFPDPRSHRILLADLAQDHILERLRKIWAEPDSLDPARISAKVTREVSDQLARLARSLEQSGHKPHHVAAYLTRALFSMFAEDVELLPKGSFLGLLQTHRENPAALQKMLRTLWADMDTPPLSLAFAVPDHPWVDSADGAAVRIAMSVGTSRRDVEGELVSVLDETAADNGEVTVAIRVQRGLIHSNLKVGANLTRCAKLQANAGMSYMGMIPLGSGFWIDREKAETLGLGAVPGFEKHVRRYLNGKDLTGTPRGILALDFYGLTAEELRERYPAAYQWLYDEVKPKRDQDKRPSRRRNWWLWGESVPKFREAVSGLQRYIGTTETAKHRTFVFIDGDVLPDQKIRAITTGDALHLGVLSSQAHVIWSLATGGTLEDRPVYNTTRCFEPFPFPDADTGLTLALADRIRQLAEQLDRHRKTQQAAHADVTLTALYNVLEKLRAGEALTAKDKTMHEHGLVGVLHSLHEELDAAVLAAYGWSDLHLPVDTDELFRRLVALNARRAAEEAAGTVRWLRPEFQKASGQGEQTALEVADETDEEKVAEVTTPAKAAVQQRPWPSGLPEQIKAVAEVLAASGTGVDFEALAAKFSGRGRWRERLPTILDTLVALGRVRAQGPKSWVNQER